MHASRLDKIERAISAAKSRAHQYIFFDKDNLTITIKDIDGNIIRVCSPDETPTLVPMLRNMTDTYQCSMGPRASGKSVTCCSKVLWVTHLNPPCRDGVKRARWMIARSTYGELKTTTIKTFEYWFGHSELDYVIRYDSPITARLKYFDGECPTELEIIFCSFDDAQSAKKALSLELTGAYFNEGASIPTVVIDNIKGSLGRYPPRVELDTLKQYLSCIIIDTNSFPDYHPLYTQFVFKKNPNHAFYRQPGAMTEVSPGEFVLNKKAENLKNLPENYYENMISGSTISFIRTQVCNEFGTHEQNKPVHPEYKADTHSVETIELDPVVPLWLFHDYGGTNATLVCQYVKGQLRCIKELVNCKDGLRKFMSVEVTGWLIQNAPDIPVSLSIGDPADNFSHENALSSSTIVTESLGIITRSALTNMIKSRIDAVDKLLLKMFAGNKPSILISRQGCQTLHAAMCGKYQLRLVKNADNGLTLEKPLKNEWSHVADCLQYASLEVLKLLKLESVNQDDLQSVVDNMSW